MTRSVMSVQASLASNRGSCRNQREGRRTLLSTNRAGFSSSVILLVIRNGSPEVERARQHLQVPGIQQPPPHRAQRRGVATARSAGWLVERTCSTPPVARLLRAAERAGLAIIFRRSARLRKDDAAHLLCHRARPEPAGGGGREVFETTCRCGRIASTSRRLLAPRQPPTLSSVSCVCGFE